MDALKIFRTKFRQYLRAISICGAIAGSILSISFYFYHQLVSTVSISYIVPTLDLNQLRLPVVSMSPITELAKPYKIARMSHKRVINIKTPSVLRENTEYLAYSNFNKLETIERRLRNEIEAKQTLVLQKEKLISWTEFIGRPIFGRNQNLAAFLEDLSDQSNNETNAQDRVSIAQSAIDKSEDLEEIVEYNFASEGAKSTPEATSNPFVSSPTVSKRMDDVIGRLMGAPKTTLHPPRSVSRAPQTRKDSYWININLGLMSGGAAIASVENFEYLSLADLSDSVLSDLGSIKMENKCAIACGVIEGKLRSSGMADVFVRVSVEEKKNVEANILGLKDEEFDGLYETHGLSSDSGVVIFDLRQKIKNIDIDRPFQKKILLDRDGKEVASTEKVQYMMFLGVEAGPATFSYQLANGWASDMQGIRAGSLHFVLPEIKTDGQHLLTFMLQDTLSSKSRPLELGAASIKPFDKNEALTQVTYNQFSSKNDYYAASYRQYRQVVAGRTGLFAGYQLSKKENLELTLPSDEFKRVIADYIGTNEEDGQCMIQINIDERIESMEIQHLNFRNEEEPLGILSLDEDGTFTSQVNSSTRNIFINSDVPGSIHLKLNLMSGSVRYLNTLCIKNTYLVEHL